MTEAAINFPTNALLTPKLGFVSFTGLSTLAWPCLTGESHLLRKIHLFETNHPTNEPCL